MRKILIISFSIIHNDPRVMRQVKLLESSCQLTVAGYGKKPDAEVGFVEIVRPASSLGRKLVWASKLLLGAYDSYYWNLPQVLHASKRLSGEKFDLILANDVSALPLALALAGDTPVLLDAHEYSPREFDDKWLWKLLFGRYNDSLCRRYLGQTVGMITVCQGIADEYARQYGVTPNVVHNAPLDQKLAPSPVENNQIRLIHHGAAIRSRHLEEMIEMMQHLDQRFSLDLMLMDSDRAYLAELHQRAADDERIRFIKPVPMPEICQHLNAYDLGVYILPPVNFNHEHALPNKFFEFVQARLGVAIGPSPEMAILVHQYHCGIVADSFDPAALAAVLTGLTKDSIEAFKQNSNTAARELSYEHEGQVLLAEIERVIDHESPQNIS